MGQLAEAKARQAQAQAEEEQSRVKLVMSEKELPKLQARWKDVEREAADGKKNLDKMEKELDRFKQKVIETGWSAENEKECETALREARNEVRRLTEVSYLCIYILYL